MDIKYYKLQYDAVPLEERQWEYECPCGYIWIDSQNNGCPMCGNTVGIIPQPYETKHPDKIQGWLFTYAGLHLVVAKEVTNCKWWRVYEYSTGYALGSKPSRTTRKKAILNAQKLLDNLGSVRICEGLQTAINQSGVLNPVELVSEEELERLPEEDAKSPFEKQILMLSDEELGKSLNKMIKIRSEIPNTLIEQWRIEDADRKIDFMQKEWQRRGGR